MTTSSIDYSKQFVIAHRVMVQIESQESENKIGSIIVTIEKKKLESFEKGIVINMGDTVFQDILEYNPLKIGDKIYFKKYAGCDLTPANNIHKDKEIRIINDEDILLIRRD